MGISFIESTAHNFNEQAPSRINSNDTNYINEIFTNNGFPPIESQAQQIKERTKKTKTYESPIMIKRSEIKLEKDGIEPTLYYISFKYTSLKPFDCSIYLNASEDFSSPISLYKQSDAFGNNKIIIHDVPAAKDQTFLEKEAQFDVKYFLDNKIFDKKYYDIIIECTVYHKESNTIECILSTYCKIMKINVNYQIRSEIQKLKVKNTWFDLQDVYGLEDNNNTNNECEACYSNKKNTIFLPCMHSYSCDDCSVYVRLRGNKCPLCREKITDTLLIEDSKRKEK